MSGGFVRIHLFVTGKGEQEFIRDLLGPVVHDLSATVATAEFIGQFSPRKVLAGVPLKVVGTQRVVPTQLEERLSLPAAAWLRADPRCLVLVIDDLEGDRAVIAPNVFDNDRAALDKCVRDESMRRRTAVHFFVNMVEAYYFAHPEAVNRVRGTTLGAHEGDVESIRHPKNELKRISPGFDERADGARIVKALDLDVVLANPATCRSLRTLVGWCVHRLGGDFGDRWRLADGAYADLTRGQIPWPADSAA